MRKALHQISAPYSDLGEAQDSLEGIVRMDGVEAAWICPESRVHFITLCVDGLEWLEPKDLQKGQRLVFLPERPLRHAA